MAVALGHVHRGVGTFEQLVDAADVRAHADHASADRISRRNCQRLQQTGVLQVTKSGITCHVTLKPKKDVGKTPSTRGSMYALVLKSTPTAVAGVVMNRESRLGNESDLTLLEQSKQCRSSDGGCKAGDVGKKPSKENYLSNLIEKVHEKLFDESKNKRKVYLRPLLDQLFLV